MPLLDSPVSAQSSVDVSHVLGLQEPLLLSGVALDSRAVVEGGAFVALQGGIGHGLSFLDQAIKKGAVVILVEAGDKVAAGVLESALPIRLLQVPSLRERLGELARVVYGDVDQSVPLVGVTGTDGKTSITHFVAQLLASKMRPAAVLGTVGNGFLDCLSDATHTTGDVFQVYRELANLASQGAGLVAMEVSSHALHQNRTEGLVFEVAVLSNLGSDHLDYHGSLENYAAAKARLFDQCAKGCVLNLDDEFGRQLQALRPDAIGYSAQAHTDARWIADKCEYKADGIYAEIGVPGEIKKVQLGVMGSFNVSNILAACAVAEQMGLSAGEILEKLPTLEPVCGRAELLVSNKGSRVVVDYAHTAQALSAILRTLREHFSARLWCVFGCGGDRDSSKRPAMARAAESVADCLVVTSDNPRNEDPQAIVDGILKGLSESACVHVELDRAAAIAYALTQAAPEDCVLIAGKGHEDYQVLSDQTVHFSDREQVLAWREGAA